MEGESSPVLLTTPVKTGRRFDVLRWAQMICSLLCMILAGVLFPKEKSYVISIIVVLAVSSAFWFISSIDVISWLLKERIRFKSWLMIAVAGFLMFCLSAGFMFKTGKGSKVLMITLGVACFVTAILFLLDILWICYSTFSDSRGKYARRSTVKPYPYAYGDSVDRAVSVCFLLDVNEYECPRMKKRYGITVKPPRKDVTPSYGGTFPVSREFAPLPSPDTKGPTSEPRRSIFSNVPSRPSRRVSMSPSRRVSMSPSRKSASPSRYGDDDQYFSTPTTSQDPYQQPTRMSTASYAPSQSPARRSQLDTVPEQDSSMRRKKGRFDDQDQAYTSRRPSERSRYESPERDQPERDHRSQRNSTRTNLDTVPELEDPRSSRAGDRESRRSAASRRYNDEQSRHSRF